MPQGNTHTLPQDFDAQWVASEGRSLFARFRKSKGTLSLDASAVQSMDSAGASWMSALQRVLQQKGAQLEIVGLQPALQEYLLRSAGNPPPTTAGSGKSGLFERWGDGFLKIANDLQGLALLLSESLWWSTFGRYDRSRLRLAGGTTTQIIRLGADALPIVFMLSFLIGLTLAFQSAVQLEVFGASLYLVRGVGISMFSEIGPLMTAIILAGRSGSSITAEISSMVVGEEVKALRTMGVSPLQFLVVPRFQALSISVPLLSVFSSLTGIMAGFIIALTYSQLPPSLFISEMREALTLTLVGQSILKSLVFGWIIALVACQKGLSVRGGADAVGRATTETVVFSISAIIVADAIFSFIFYW